MGVKPQYLFEYLLLGGLNVKWVECSNSLIDWETAIIYCQIFKLHIGFVRFIRIWYFEIFSNKTARFLQLYTNTAS